MKSLRGLLFPRFVRFLLSSSRPSAVYIPCPLFPFFHSTFFLPFPLLLCIYNFSFEMSILSLVEDRPTPKEVYNWRVYLLAAVASFTSCMIGYDSAFIGTTLSLQSFKDEFNWENLDSDLVSANIVSLYQAGAFFGALFAYPTGHFFGRRWGLMASALVFFLGAGLMLGANGDRGLGLIYGGRVLAGIGVGAGSNLCPIYISEMAPPAIRGRLVGVYELGWQLGGVVGFWINVCSFSSDALFQF